MTTFTQMIATRAAFPPTRSRTPVPGGQGGLVDLLIVLMVMLTVAFRTPVGGMLYYTAERVRNENAEMPSLTAYFTAEESWISPFIGDLEVLPPEESPPEPTDAGAVPEPYRTAVRAALADGLPRHLKDILRERGWQPTPAQAMTVLDELWSEKGDPELVLELAAIGAEQRDRAVARAVAAGEWEPERYAGHRRYLPSRAMRDGDRFVSGAMALATVLQITWPIQIPHRLSSGFGYRIHPVLKVRRFHNGVDMSVAIGTPVVAAQSGRVTLVGNSNTSGKYVVLDHGHGVRTSYLHLDSHEVKWGTNVEAGQLIATSGNSGMSTGPHLHFVVRVGGRAIDPARFKPANVGDE
ncbi:MAG: M23 family metallopeptidase [Myxococcota bacterium]